MIARCDPGNRVSAATQLRQAVSTHDDVRRRRQEGNLGDQLLDDRPAERVEILRHQDECAGAADDVVLVVFLEPAGRVGVLGVPGHRPVAENDQAVDDDALGERLVAREPDVTAGIVGAVAGDVDGATRRLEWEDRGPRLFTFE